MQMEQMSQALSIQGQIAPQSVAPGTADCRSVDMQKFKRAMFILDVGAFGAAATVDMKLQGSPDNVTFTDLATLNPNLSNVAITQLLAAGGNNRLVTLEIRDDQLAQITSQNCRYIGARVTVGTAATLLSCVALGGEAVASPGSAADIGAVAQRQVVAGPT